LEWLDAHAKGDLAARARLSRMQSVEGGRVEELRLDYVAPAPAAPDQRLTVEYYHAGFNHYFITAEPAEMAILDAGELITGWQRTGYDFNAFAPGSARGASTCRFYGTPGRGPNTHFFTAYAHECDLLRNNPDWLFEALAFQVFTPGVGTCPEDLVVVWRLYNNGMGGVANHRYLTSYSVIGDMIGAGWTLEGPAFCTAP
jgi:serine protease